MYIYINKNMYTHTTIHKHIFTPICSYVYKTQMCVRTHIHRYAHTSVYVHISKYIRWECYKCERLPDSMVGCAEFLNVHNGKSHQHTPAYIPQIHKCSNLGLFQWKEYTWHFDCPYESDEVLILSINTPNPSSCLEKASQCIVLKSRLFKHWLQKIETRVPKRFLRVKVSLQCQIITIKSKFPPQYYFAKNSNKNSNIVHYWNDMSDQ